LDLCDDNIEEFENMANLGDNGDIGDLGDNGDNGDICDLGVDGDLGAIGDTSDLNDLGESGNIMDRLKWLESCFASVPFGLDGMYVCTFFLFSKLSFSIFKLDSLKSVIVIVY
jgi:hypothetical protein